MWFPSIFNWYATHATIHHRIYFTITSNSIPSKMAAVAAAMATTAISTYYSLECSLCPVNASGKWKHFIDSDYIVCALLVYLCTLHGIRQRFVCIASNINSVWAHRVRPLHAGKFNYTHKSFEHKSGDRRALMNCLGSYDLFEYTAQHWSQNQTKQHARRHPTERTVTEAAAAAAAASHQLLSCFTMCHCVSVVSWACASVCLIIRRKWCNKWCCDVRACTNLSPKCITDNEMNVVQPKCHGAAIGRYPAHELQFDKLVFCERERKRWSETCMTLGSVPMWSQTKR